MSQYVEIGGSGGGGGGLSPTLASGKIFVGNASNVATAVTPGGQVTMDNTGAFTLTNASVIGKVLTGFSAAAGTVADSDSILQAFNKIVGNIALKVTGPAGATANGYPMYDGSTGYLLKDGPYLTKDASNTKHYFKDVTEIWNILTSSGSGPIYGFRACGNGSAASPSRVQNGQVIAEIISQSHDGSVFSDHWYMYAEATENFDSNTAKGVNINWNWAKTGTNTTSTKLRFAGNGNVKFLTAPELSATAVALTADDQVVDLTNRSSVHLTSDDGTPTNRTFTLTGGTAGQLCLLVSNEPTNAFELADSGNTILSAAWSLTGKQGSTLLLYCLNTTGPVWVEVARSTNS